MKNPERAKKIAVVVGTVTNDLRVFDVPKLSVSFSAKRSFFFEHFFK